MYKRQPVVKGASVKCKILKHLKDEKVLVFKKKRRTGYQKCNGHRQYHGILDLTDIGDCNVYPTREDALENGILCVLKSTLI